MRELFLMRHGMTWENKVHTVIGQNDPSLMDEAIKEIESIRPNIFKFDLILSSDLKRALQTTYLLFPKQKIKALSQLRERHFGELQGKSRSMLTGVNLYKLDKEDNDFVFNGLEPLSSVIKRINYVSNLIKRSNASRVLIVSHGSFLSYFLNVLLSENLIHHPLNNLHYHKILYDNQGNIKEIIFNQNWLTKEKND